MNTTNTIGDAVCDAVFQLTRTMDTLSQLTTWRIATEVADQQVRDLVRAAREEHRPWSQIGIALGMSKQGAQQKYRFRCACGVVTQHKPTTSCAVIDLDA